MRLDEIKAQLKKGNNSLSEFLSGDVSDILKRVRLLGAINYGIKIDEVTNHHIAWLTIRL